jgi:hypothetical protein
VNENPEHFSTSIMSREIFEAHEVCAVQSQSSAPSTSSKSGSSQMTNENMRKVETMLTTEYDPPSISISKYPTLSKFKSQPPRELKFKLENGLHSQAEGSSSDTSFTSDSLASDSSMSYSHRVPSGDMEDFQELHVHLDDTRICMGQRQNAWVHKGVSWKCQDKNFTPAERRVIPPGSKGEKLISEDSGLETSRAIRQCHSLKERKLEKKPFPTESYFRKKMRQFFQWIDSRRKKTEHKTLEKDRALFMSCGPPEAHELMAALGKLLEEKLACRQKPESLKLSHQTELNKGQPSNYEAASDPQQGEGSHLCSCNQALSPGWSCLTSVEQNSDRIRPPQELVAFREQL